MLPKMKLWLGALLAPLIFASSQAFAAWELNMPVGVTEISRQTYGLHMTIIIISTIISVLVYGVLVWSFFKYRHSKGAKPATWHENTKVEIVWTVIPFLILIGMAIPSTQVLREIYDTSDSELDIMVSGYQWRWQYEYLSNDGGENVSFFSNMSTPQDQINNLSEKGEHYLLEVDEPMVIPVDTKVRLLITAADVLHSWWVPEFAVKKDAVPGFINESWVNVEVPGIYRGSCTELCGRDHGFMPVVVEVMEKEDFEAWYEQKREAAAALAELANEEWSLAQLVERGETVYRTYCMACHQEDGTGLPPAFPGLVGSPSIEGPIEEHIDIVLNGVPGTSMTAFGGVLGPVDLAAVITYERNAWGIDSGEMVTPVGILEIQSAE